MPGRLYDNYVVCAVYFIYYAHNSSMRAGILTATVEVARINRLFCVINILVESVFLMLILKMLKKQSIFKLFKTQTVS